MGNTLKADIRRAIINRTFILSVIGMIVCVIVASLDSFKVLLAPEAGLLPNGFHAEALFNALESDIIVLVVPIFAALPFTASYLDDTKSGFIKSYLPRTRIDSYIRGKIVSAGISGGLALALGIVFTYFLFWLVLSPLEAAPIVGDMIKPPIIDLLGHAIMFFLSGALWALVGLLLASVTGSKYVAYASPFILYYVLIILYERYFKIYCLYPKEWLVPSDAWVMGSIGAVILLLMLIGITAFSFAIFARRKLAYV